MDVSKAATLGASQRSRRWYSHPYDLEAPIWVEAGGEEIGGRGRG